MTRRLFVALDLDAPARQRVATISAGLQSQIEAMPANRPRVTWVAPGRMHITLHFIGAVDDARAECLASAMSRPFAHAPVQVELDALGVFPVHGRPRVIWMGVRRGAGTLHWLYTESADRLAACGCAVESRGLTPHVTLGRVRQGTLRGLKLPRVDPPVQTTVTHVILYDSQLSSRGPQYTALARAALSEQRD